MSAHDRDDRRAKKSLGQHFLFDKNLTRKIVRQAGDLSAATVIEIGPGPGGLTEALLETSVKRLILVEKDDRFAADWRARAQIESRLSVFQGDALEIAEERVLQELGEAGPAIIISNLPYNVGTPLLIKWLRAGAWRGPMTLMFQLEVAERICAAPGSSAYGRLSVIAQSRSRPRLAMRVPASAFTPPPKVDSGVVHFETLAASDLFADLDALEAVTAAAFGQRRKMLRQSLKQLAAALGISAVDYAESAGIDPTARPEDLPPQAFQQLATIYSSRRHIDPAKAPISV
jgi:16S rRNA (adenine1518-N6/adenine1519-N6)-dimethyltransferase